MQRFTKGRAHFNKGTLVGFDPLFPCRYAHPSAFLTLGFAQCIPARLIHRCFGTDINRQKSFHNSLQNRAKKGLSEPPPIFVRGVLVPRRMLESKIDRRRKSELADKP